MDAVPITIEEILDWIDRARVKQSTVLGAQRTILKDLREYIHNPKRTLSDVLSR